jgi:hypothetical protein
MCVERTARTKLPSARESRASVARQYRAAARAEMSWSNLVCAWLMFNKLKVAQPEKQIYPERKGQTSGSWKGDWLGCLRPWRHWLRGGFMVSSVCRIGSGIRESHMVCGRALVACSRCGGILWRGRIRTASSLASVGGAKLRLLPERRFRASSVAVSVAPNYAGVQADVSPIYRERSSK